MKKRSERSRWTQVFVLEQPYAMTPEGAQQARTQHDQLRAVVKAFESVGRVVRIEISKHGSGLVFKARKA